jgi:hypothetical protein
LTTFVRRQLGSGMSIDDASWNALAEEIWNADTNAHLRVVPRDSAVAGDASAGNLLLLADEWIYLPAAPPPPYSLQQVWAEAGESDAALITDVLSDASSKGLNIPGDAITIDQLHEVVFNSLLRAPSSSNIPQPVYYYTVPIVSTIVDAVPTTSGAALMNPAFGTPPWLPTLWHWIDKWHDALDVLETAIEHLEDLKGAGQIAVAILTKMVKFLDAYEKIDKDEPISGNGCVPGSGQERAERHRQWSREPRCSAPAGQDGRGRVCGGRAHRQHAGFSRRVCRVRHGAGPLPRHQPRTRHRHRPFSGV